MIIFTYEDYLKNILKLDISSVFLKKYYQKKTKKKSTKKSTQQNLRYVMSVKNTFQIHQMKSTKKIKKTIQKNRAKPKQTRI